LGQRTHYEWVKGRGRSSQSAGEFTHQARDVSSGYRVTRHMRSANVLATSVQRVDCPATPDRRPSTAPERVASERTASRAPLHLPRPARRGARRRRRRRIWMRGGRGGPQPHASGDRPRVQLRSLGSGAPCGGNVPFVRAPDPRARGPWVRRGCVQDRRRRDVQPAHTPLRDGSGLAVMAPAHPPASCAAIGASAAFRTPWPPPCARRSRRSAHPLRQAPARRRKHRSRTPPREA
jgi:hypothetical protein